MTLVVNILLAVIMAGLMAAQFYMNWRVHDRRTKRYEHFTKSILLTCFFCAVLSGVSSWMAYQADKVQLRWNKGGDSFCCFWLPSYSLGTQTNVVAKLYLAGDNPVYDLRATVIDCNAIHYLLADPMVMDMDEIEAHESDMNLGTSYPNAINMIIADRNYYPNVSDTRFRFPAIHTVIYTKSYSRRVTGLLGAVHIHCEDEQRRLHRYQSMSTSPRSSAFGAHSQRVS